jgi:hypothetical protein
MRRVTWLLLLLGLAGCTSAEEKARAREQEMVAQAQADSAAEADFVADSLALAASITLDTIRELRILDVKRVDDNGYEFTQPAHQAIGTTGQVCALTVERYIPLIRGDTLSCQWGPPE